MATEFANILQHLITTTGMSIAQISEKTNISVTIIRNYCNNITKPTLENVIAIADFFAIPVDVLIGRCKDTKAYDDIINNYSNHFSELRKAPYETYLQCKRRETHSYMYMHPYEAPWPYNLFDDCNSTDNEHIPIDWILTETNIQNMYTVLNTLTAKEREVLLLHYKDGLSFQKIAVMREVSRSCVSTMVTNAISKLRHPSKRSLMLSPYTMNDLKTYEKKLQSREKELDLRIKNFDKYMDEVFKKGKQPNQTDWIIYNKDLDITVQDMKLSSRTQRCLERTGITKLSTILTLLKTDEGYDTIRNIHQLGNKSFRELINKVNEITNENFKY